ncbi:MAG: DUF1080 domain-containing protein, partial [Steroidobacteraceae bacterium]
TAKIAGHAVGENYADTFRVENGILRIAYDKYGQFGEQFGGLYYKDKFSHYWIRVEYRFVGDQAAGAPAWAVRDSGIFLHAQSPNSMQKDQQFPVSLELNMLGASFRGRPTGDVCTNGGVTIVVNGAKLTDKCTRMSSTTMRGDQWVTAEAEVKGGTSIKHYVNGQLIVEYQQPQLSSSDPDSARLLAAGANAQIIDGYIGLESNGHPVEFRKIEILPLDTPTANVVTDAPSEATGNSSEHSGS